MDEQSPLIHCPKCGDDKPEDEFANNKSRPNGKSGYCKHCMRGLVKEWKKANPEQLRDQQKRANERKKRIIAFKAAQIPLPLEG
jgi:hypothetical protein